MLLFDQLVVPMQLPEPPLSLDHVTEVTPTLSDAVPPIEIVLELVEWVDDEVGLVMTMLGSVVSGTVYVT